MINRLLQIAEDAAVSAGKEIMRVFATGNPVAVLKEDESPVTKADSLADIIISEQLAKTGLPVLSEEGKMVPYKQRKDWEMFWMVDPLDGTKEFIKGLDEFTVNIALIHQQIPVAGVICLPWQELIYRGEPDAGVWKIDRGQQIKMEPLADHRKLCDLISKPGTVVIGSRSHQSPSTHHFIEQLREPVVKVAGSSIKFIHLLEGRADVYPRFEPSMEWDTAAGHALLKLTNRGVYQVDLNSELLYNKPDLVNPSFIAL